MSSELCVCGHDKESHDFIDDRGACAFGTDVDCSDDCMSWRPKTAPRDAQVARRLVVELNNRSIRDLTSAVEAEGTTKTTTVNRAIQVYELVRATQASGGYIVRVQPDGTQERVMLL